MNMEQSSAHRDMVLRTIDPDAILAAFSPAAATDVLEAHRERRRLLRAGLWIGARPRAVTASTAAELGACVATLVLSAGRGDVMPGLKDRAPDLRSIAASLGTIIGMDDAGMTRWWSDLNEAAAENAISDASVEAMAKGTVVGMRSVVSTLGARVAAAAEKAATD